MEPLPSRERRHVQPSDLRALAQMATQAVVGVTHIVEGVHQSVWATLGVAGGDRPGSTGGLTGLIYKSIRTVAQLLGAGAEQLLTRLPSLQGDGADEDNATVQRTAVVSILNGVMGDRLAASKNPLAITMQLRYRGQPLDLQAAAPLPGATGRVLLLIHGLCMNELNWQASSLLRGGRPAPESDHAQALADAYGYTPVYLRYNSGLHISQNGRALSALLQQLVERWPVAIDDLSVLAHSMGGLLMRSALYYGREQGLGWPAYVRNVVFLGTPHHGAPLERAGNRVDALLGSTPYSAPFARLGQLRSAGITDLRYGNLLDDDWLDHDRFRRKADSRRPVPLPEGVACFAVAASSAAKGSTLAERLIGDGLVPLPSALGQHADARRQLGFAREAQRVVYRTRHIDLLHSAEVTHRLLQWLQPSGKDAAGGAANNESKESPCR